MNLDKDILEIEVVGPQIIEGLTYFDFQRELRGYDYFCKKTNKQIYRYQMYYWGLTPKQCMENYNLRIRNNR